MRANYDVVRVVSSPFRRARQTAEIVATPLGLSVEIETEIREQNLGDLHGQPYEAAAASKDFDPERRWEWRPPQGETLLEVQARAIAALRPYLASHAEDDVAVVSHAGTIFSIWAHVLEDWQQVRGIPNASVLAVRHDGERFQDAVLWRPEEH